MAVIINIAMIVKLAGAVAAVDNAFDGYDDAMDELEDAMRELDRY